ncbi:VOC family protein [Nocardia sp. NPDC052566]|uniref:VOC family protein n=1 Tax=Nocardia sp. NPDC052566 TaxID=3364330 RepID=UPI0037CBA693
MTGLLRIRHIKLPVDDLARSVAWYRDLLGMELAAEFCEDGQLRGAQLMHPSGFGIALRQREYCVGKPDLTGFDVFAIEVDSVAELHALAERADAMGSTQHGVSDNGEYGAFLNIIDPDGLMVRFLANNPINHGRFVGVDSTRDGMSLYPTPRSTDEPG